MLPFPLMALAAGTSLAAGTAMVLADGPLWAVALVVVFAPLVALGLFDRGPFARRQAVEALLFACFIAAAGAARSAAGIDSWQLALLGGAVAGYAASRIARTVSPPAPAKTPW